MEIVVGSYSDLHLVILVSWWFRFDGSEDHWTEKLTVTR